MIKTFKKDNKYLKRREITLNQAILLDSAAHTGLGMVLSKSLFADEKPQLKPEMKEPQPEYKEAPPPPIDWDLYRCKGCGQMQLGFARYEHVRNVHKGVDPGFEKVKES